MPLRPLIKLTDENIWFFYYLTLTASIPDEERKLMKVLKAFTKPFEAPQRTVKIKVKFLSSSGLGWEGLNKVGCISVIAWIYFVQQITHCQGFSPHRNSEAAVRRCPSK